MLALNKIRIVPAGKNQIPKIARLCAELGYPSTDADVEQRLEHILGNPIHAVFVATDVKETALGWVHIYEVHLLMVDQFAEVGGLIVSESSRGLGVGAQLMEQAESWASERCLSLIRLRSNIQRDDAHLFYQDRGYSIEKTSYTLTKTISG